MNKPLFAGFVLIVLLAIQGCASSTQPTTVHTSEKQTPKAQTTDQKPKAEIKDLSQYLGKDISDAEKELGEPKDKSGTQSSGIYTYQGFIIYYDSQSNKVTQVQISNPKYSTAGIKIGMTPDEVRKILGRARDEQNVADSFQMKYIIQNLKLLLITDDFRSPLKGIIIMENGITFSGQKKVTQDEAKSLIQGQWLMEETGFTPQHPQDFLIIFADNNRRDRSLHTDTAYKITSEKTIEFQVKHSMGMDDTWDEWHFAFLDEGDTLRLYKLDKYEEIDPSNMEIYYRYSK